MPPASIRTPSKRNIAAFPETSRLTFLLAASQLLAETVPQASSHLGCQALKWADTKQLPLPRGLLAQLCRQCGAHCSSKGAVLVKSSRAQRRRKLQCKTHTQHRHSEQKIVAVLPCQVCNGYFSRSFVNQDAAHKAFPQAALVPVAKIAARHLADKSKPTAVPGLPSAVLREPHLPPTTHQANSVQQEPLQAAGCADAEHQHLQAASLATPQQPHQTNIELSAYDRACLLDFSADTAVEPACVAPSRGVATQDAALSMQLEVTVHNPERHHGAPGELIEQHAQTPASLSPGPQMETHQATEEQTASPKLVRQTTAQLLHPVSATDTGNAQVADETKWRDEMAHDWEEAPAPCVPKDLADIAPPAAEAQSDVRPGSAMLTTAPYEAAVKKRRSFSWRKHGRSWRYKSPKQVVSQHVNGRF